MNKRQQRRRKLEQIKDKLLDHQLPEGAENSEEQPRSEQMPNDEAWQWLVENRIQQAMNEGAFDNLAGKGKPLDLKKNPYLDPGQALAFDLLQNNQAAPEWIERDKAIRWEWDTARRQLREAWQAYQADPTQEADWQAALTRFEVRLQKINRRIDDFNLMVPVLSCQRVRLRLADELHWVKRDEVE